jgi:anti-sigma regulatory factor (Ser/Thr protein kinase)
VITRWQFDADRDVIGDARRMADAVVADQSEDVRGAVALLVSELCTNAVVHAGTSFELMIERSRDGVRVQVTDGAGGTPRPRDAGDDELHGRGLRIVEELSDDWGSTVLPGRGTAVWAWLAFRSEPVGAA